MDKIFEYFKEVAKEKQLCAVHFVNGTLYLEHNDQQFILGSEAKISDKVLAETVITYLNERGGKSFRATKSNITPIIARLREGFRLQDFYAVVDIKLKTWGKDPNFAKYVRPNTLFGTKMDSYVQEAKEKQRDAKSMIDDAFKEAVIEEKHEF